MVGVDGVDNADVGAEVQEGTVELVGLHDHDAVAALTQQQVAVEVVGDAADKGGGVLATGVQDVGHHGRGGRLAMRSRDGECKMVL